MCLSKVLRKIYTPEDCYTTISYKIFRLISNPNKFRGMYFSSREYELGKIYVAKRTIVTTPKTGWGTAIQIDFYPSGFHSYKNREDAFYEFERWFHTRLVVCEVEAIDVHTEGTQTGYSVLVSDKMKIRRVLKELKHTPDT